MHLSVSLIPGSRPADVALFGSGLGAYVVIDILRASTVLCTALANGAREIIPIADHERALKLRKESEDTDALVCGERAGQKLPGFDLGNSPSAILQAGRDRFAGRVVAQRTSAGVTGAVAAAEAAERVILGSYVMAGAIARYIETGARPKDTVSLVAMGSGGEERTPDDELCADYLEHLLIGRPYDHALALKEIVAHECTQKFLRGDQAHYPAADAVYCLQRDLFDFVLLAELNLDRLVARRVDVP